MDTSKRTKDLPLTLAQNQVVGFITDLSNSKSILTNRMEGNGKNKKPQNTLGTFLWCCAEIAPNNRRSGYQIFEQRGNNMTNFRGHSVIASFRGA